MDFIDLIPAARSLLNWSQTDLATHCGFNQATIVHVEKRNTTPRAQTLYKVKKVLEEKGIVFLDNGVIRQEDDVRVFSGDDCYVRLLDDIEETLHPGDEFLIWCANDAVSPPLVNKTS